MEKNTKNDIGTTVLYCMAGLLAWKLILIIIF